jgi:hypothetical protein
MSAYPPGSDGIVLAHHPARFNSIIAGRRTYNVAMRSGAASLGIRLSVNFAVYALIH